MFLNSLALKRAFICGQNVYPFKISWFPPPKKLEKTNLPHANLIIIKLYTS